MRGRVSTPGPLSPRPGYSAMIWPVFGSCSSAPISAQDGSVVTVAPAAFLIWAMFSSTALYISSSIGRLIVVVTFSPPLSSSVVDRPS